MKCAAKEWKHAIIHAREFVPNSVKVSLSEEAIVADELSDWIAHEGPHDLDGLRECRVEHAIGAPHRCPKFVTIAMQRD